MYIAQQTTLFLQSILVGVALGVFYEPFRLLRAAARMPAWVIFVEDAVYFATAGFITFSFMLSENAGRIRLALITGELIGASLYIMTLGEVINRLLTKIVIILKRVFSWIWRRIFSPVLRTALKPFAIVGKKVKFFFNNMKTHLKNNIQILYNRGISIFAKKNKEKRKRTE